MNTNAHLPEAAKHTPAPWQVNHNDPLQICDADGEVRGCAPIATMSGKRGEAKANARRIVQCVNVHDELVASVSELLREAGGPRWPAARDRAKNLIAKIGGAA